MVCSTLGDTYVILQLYKKKIRIPIAKSAEIQFILSMKLQMYSWMWKSKDKVSICDLLKSFYAKYINNRRKVFFSEMCKFEFYRIIL